MASNKEWNGMGMRGQYIAVGAILGVAVGLFFGRLTEFAVLGVGLGYLASILNHKN